jgi:hypothetical protein
MRVLDEAIGTERVMGELSRQIAIERWKIVADVEGFAAKGPPPPVTRDIDYPHRRHLQTLVPALASHARKPRGPVAELASMDASVPVRSTRDQGGEIFDGSVATPRRGDVAALSDCRTTYPVLRPEKHVGQVTGLAIAPERRHAATCSEEKPLEIWTLPDRGR